LRKAPHEGEIGEKRKKRNWQRMSPEKLDIESTGKKEYRVTNVKKKKKMTVLRKKKKPLGRSKKKRKRFGLGEKKTLTVGGGGFAGTRAPGA